MNMTRKDIIRELNRNGYEVSTCTIIKNGVERCGIRFMENRELSPVIYLDEYLKNINRENLNDIVSEIIEIYKKNKNIDIDVNLILKRNYILQNIFVGCQKESNEYILKKKSGFDGIEKYLYVRTNEVNDSFYSMKINERILKITEIDEEDAWRCAEKNSNSETKIDYMYMPEKSMIYIITNKNGIKGASAILNKREIERLGKWTNTNKFIVLPSSIHEMLLVPYEDGMQLEHFSEIVAEVNHTEVAPEERLADRAYIIEI